MAIVCHTMNAIAELTVEGEGAWMCVCVSVCVCMCMGVCVSEYLWVWVCVCRCVCVCECDSVCHMHIKSIFERGMSIQLSPNIFCFPL